MNTILNSLNKKTLSLKAQIIAILFGIASAVALPQIVHLLGAAAGVGTLFGELFLPMHFSVIFIGLAAGRRAGAIAGFFSPLVSFFLTSMPGIVVLPFMMIELMGYGFFAGLLKNAKAPVFLKVLFAQIAGRALRFLAIGIAFFGFSYTKVAPMSVWMSVPRGLVGIVLQLVLIPLLIFRLTAYSGNDR
mgnify:CR=1 FL=1